MSLIDNQQPATGDRFYVAGGTLRHDAACYVVRQADHDLHEGLTRGEFCYVLTARQMGKSSLMARTAARLRQEGVAVAVLDLTGLGQNLSPDQWYGGLLRLLGEQLDPTGSLEEQLDAFWWDREHLGPLQRWLTALRQIVLPHLADPRQRVPTSDQRGEEPTSVVGRLTRPNRDARLVIFIDEIDAVRSLPFSTDEFFAGVRECYNRRSEDREYERLAFCLLGVASPSDLIQDVRMTPFNIGRRIELADFTEAEAAPLAAGLVGGEKFTTETRRHGEAHGGKTEAEAGAFLRRVLYWTGGHPYLTQRLCRAIAEARGAQEPSASSPCSSPRGPAPGAVARCRSRQSAPPPLRVSVVRSSAPNLVDQLCEELFLSPRARERDDNLLFVRERILRSEVDQAGLLDLYRQVRSGQKVVVDETNPLVDVLRLSGVTRVADGRLWVRNRIYQRVFDRAWLTAHMPDAELRRQRAAYRRGLVRASAVSAAILAVVGGLALTARVQALRADRNATKARAGEVAVRRHLYAAQMHQIQQAWEAGNVTRARELLLAQRPKPGEEDLRGFEWRLFWQLCASHSLATLQGHEDGVQSVAISPDGKTLATASAGDGTARLWDGASYRAIATLRHPSDAVIRAVAYSPDGRTLATAGDRVWLWDLRARRQPASLALPAVGMEYVAFSPDGRLLASSARQGGPVWLWDLHTRRRIAILPMPHHDRPWPAFSPDGKLLAVCAGDQSVWLWRVTTRQVVGRLRGHRGFVVSVAFSPDGKTLASTSVDGAVKLWNVGSRREVATLHGHRAWVASVAFSPDGRTLATSSVNGSVKLWDVATREEKATLKGHSNWVNQVAFFPDGHRLASACDDRTVRVWDVRDRPDSPELGRHRDAVTDVLFSPDGKRFATASLDTTIRLWNVTPARSAATRGRASATLRGGMGWDGWTSPAVFSADGRLLASVNMDGTLHLWRSAPRADPVALATLRPQSRKVFCAGFSRDGRTLAYGCDDGAVRLWDVRNRQSLGTLGWHQGGVWRVLFLPDGRTLASFAADKTISLWDLSTRRPLASLRKDTGELRREAITPEAAVSMEASPDGRTLLTLSPRTLHLWDGVGRRAIAALNEADFIWPAAVAFSVDGRALAVGLADGSISLWDVVTRKRLATLRGHGGIIWSVAFSPDGRTLASNASDGTVRLWNLTIRQEVAALDAGPESKVAFSPDGSALASAGHDGIVRLWRAAPSTKE